MKVKIEKKQLLISIALASLIVVSMLVFLKVSAPTTGQQSLESFLNSCRDVAERRVECEVFVAEESTNNKGDRCFRILTQEKIGSLNEVSFCLESSKIEWENPYSDYTLPVPVVLEIDYRETFLKGGYKLTKVEGMLMGDERVLEILESINAPGVLSYINPMLQSAAVIEEKGYYITPAMDENRENTLRDLVVVSEVEIKGYEVREEGIFLEVALRLNGEEIDTRLKSIREGGFSYLFEGADREREFMEVTPENLKDKVALGGKYSAVLSIEEEKFFSEDVFSEYVERIENGEKVLFILEVLDSYKYE